METTEFTGGQDPNLVWVKVSLKFQTQDGAWVGVETGEWVKRENTNVSLIDNYGFLERREQAIKDKRKAQSPI